MSVLRIDRSQQVRKRLTSPMSPARSSGRDASGRLWEPSSVTRKVAIYARISISQDESVSLERQIAAAEQYSAARDGWEVVATFKDDGVSASHNKPEDRAGWRALL